MHQKFTFLLFCLFSLSASAQVGIGTNQPQAGLHVLDSNVVFSAAGDVPATPKSFPLTGQGRRMFWYAEKAAFRAGYVGASSATVWNTNNIGNYSFAVGSNTQASGESSFAAGSAGRANGSSAMAFNGWADALGTIALGSGAQAVKDHAVAIGFNSIAGGQYSLATVNAIANGAFSTAIGVSSVARSMYSVALGRTTRVNHAGSMVFGDASASFIADSVYSTANNQLTMRFVGGIKMYTSMNLTSGVQLLSGGSSWSVVSDRRKKENFQPVDKEDVLKKIAQLPITRWNYKTQPAEQHHIGPMAQDFYQAFKLDGKGNDTTINTVDIDGVNMVAIQALEARTQKLQAENQQLLQQLALIQERLLQLESRQNASSKSGKKPQNDRKQPLVALQVAETKYAKKR